MLASGLEDRSWEGGGPGLMARSGLIQTGVQESPTTTEAMRLVCIYTVQAQGSGMMRLQKPTFPDLSVHITFKFFMP